MKKQHRRGSAVAYDKGGKIIDCENLDCSFIMNSPATIENILKCDAYCKQKLPEEYKYFLKYYDGGILYKYENLGGFKFLSTQEIIDANELQKTIYEEYWDGSIIFFCELLGTGEYLGFKISDTASYKIVHSETAQHEEEWIVAGNSFDALIELIISEKGKECCWFQT
ncbi:hypothetical protein FACS189426_07600 [Bacteroidia bacterium]|nr:hypothetical protein FACS189426_07600 [Bacteroidia bacterium]GHT84160.1 hypothetical protein FACS18947_1210 [Bacteroidia bacterium]